MKTLCAVCLNDEDEVPAGGVCLSEKCNNKPLCLNHCESHQKRGHTVVYDQEEEYQLVIDNDNLKSITVEEQEKINFLCNRILASVSRTEERIKNYNKITKWITSKFCSPLIGNMKQMIEELKTKGTSNCNVYIVGNTGSAKTTLFKTIFDEEVTDKEIDDDKPCEADTTNPVIRQSAGLMCNLIDTAGFGDSNTKEYADKIVDLCSDHPPDIVLFCFTSQTLRESTNFKGIVDKCIEISKKAKTPAPIIPVLTKIDGFWKEEAPFTEETLVALAKKNLAASQNKWKDLFKKFMSIPPKSSEKELVPFTPEEEIEYMLNNVVYCCFRPSRDRNGKKKRSRIGLKNLLETINLTLSTTSVKQLRLNNESAFFMRRRAISGAIISSFSAMNAAISAIPLLDIPITYFLTDQMLELLSCFSSNQAKSIGSFKIANIITFLSMNAARVGALIASSLLQVSGVVSFGVGTVIGLGVGAVVGSTSTAAIGLIAYNYFVDPFLTEVADVTCNVDADSVLSLSLNDSLMCIKESSVKLYNSNKNYELEYVETIQSDNEIVSVDLLRDRDSILERKYFFINSAKNYLISATNSTNISPLDGYSFKCPRIVSINRYNNDIAVCDCENGNYNVHILDKEYSMKKTRSIPADLSPKFMFWRNTIIEKEFWRSDEVVSEIVIGDKRGQIFSLKDNGNTWEKRNTGLSNIIGMSIINSGLIVCADADCVYVLGNPEANVEKLKIIDKFKLSNEDGFQIHSISCVKDIIYAINQEGKVKVIK